MRPSINFRVDRVVREGTSEPLFFAWTPALQPEDPSLVRALLSPRDYGVPDKGVRLCRMRDGVWQDVGPAPEMRDPSWHPELPDYMAEYVAIARRVIDALGHCSCIDVFLEDRDDGEGAHSLVSTALFSKRDDEKPGMTRGLVDELTLDAVPYVRHVERAGIHAATYFGVSAYENGGGPDAKFAMRIASDALEISCGAGEDDGVHLTSTLRDGIWSHETVVKALDVGDDVVEAMRTIADPLRRLRACAADCKALATVMGEPADCRAQIICVEDPDDGGLVTFRVVPGSLKASDS